MTALTVLQAGFAGLGPRQDHQRQMYGPALAAHPGFEVVAELDGTDPEEIASAVKESDVDVVSVCAPLEDREEAVTAALRAGAHVLADKPLAADPAACRRIAAVAAETGRRCVPALHLRFHPMLTAAASTVASGRVGLPWNVQSDFVVAGGTPCPAGELVNLAVYPIDVVQALTGQPVRRVHARARRHWTSDSDDFVLLAADHTNGVTSTISVGRTGPLADAAPGAPVLHRYRVSGSGGRFDIDATAPAVSVRTATDTHRSWHGPATVTALLDDLHRALTTGRAPAVGAETAATVADVVAAAQRSIDSGEPEDVR